MDEAIWELLGNIFIYGPLLKIHIHFPDKLVQTHPAQFLVLSQSKEKFFESFCNESKNYKRNTHS